MNLNETLADIARTQVVIQYGERDKQTEVAQGQHDNRDGGETVCLAGLHSESLLERNDGTQDSGGDA